MTASSPPREPAETDPIAGPALAAADARLTAALQVVESTAARLGRSSVDLTDTGYAVVPILGQSNAVGAGNVASVPKLDPPHGQVFMFPSSGADLNAIVQGLDPLSHPLGQSSQLGPGMPAARWIASGFARGRPVLLVPCAASSTGFETGTGGYQWKVGFAPADRNLYLLAVAQIDAALAAGGAGSRVAGVIWMQGESDALTTANAALYEANLDTLIDALRVRYGATMPFVCLRMAQEFRAAYAPAATTVDAVHIDTPRRKLYTGFADPRLGLGFTSDGSHYTAPAQRRNGRAAADAMVRATYNVLGVAPLPVTGLTLTQSGSNILAAWNLPYGRVTDFTVQYRVTGAGAWTTLTRTSPNIAAEATIPITPGQSYEARVLTVNEQGVSAPSASATLLTVVAPGQVTGLAAGATTASAVPLTWNALAGAASYLVEYKASASGTWLTAGTSPSPALTVGGLASVTSYDFRVTGQNAGGAGTPSATVTAATQNIGFLLTDVPVAAARALGPRKLSSAYAGAAMRVRRSSDNTEQDIGFSGGNLDTAALLTFAGAGSAFVVTWYDQSGNARHRTQATASKQPRIVNAGVLDTLNGKPTVVADGVDDIFTDAALGAFAAGAASVLSVLKLLSTATAAIFGESRSATTNGTYRPLACSAGKLYMLVTDDAGVGSPNVVGTTLINDQLHQVSVVDTGTLLSQFADGAQANTPTTYTRSGRVFTLDRSSMFGNFRTGVEELRMNVAMAEHVEFHTALSTAQRQAGEANQKSYYGTP